MSEEINEFGFVPKTDETFIAPNDQFNSFSQNFNKRFGLKTNETQVSPRVDGSDNGVRSALKSSETFVDFVVKQYKSDGFVCTLDENERQIYYCYYCHQYVHDFDLIQTHIDSAKHLNSVLNGISLKKGLDKEFVIETISEKRPKNIESLIVKELSRLPLHLKHYYFRNGIRLMDALPPNAYYCTLCKQSIPKINDIERHLSTDSHMSCEQKPTLMQLIDSSDDLTLKIGLKFITEDKISSDSAQVVYECQLCDCIDCNNEKMFTHLKSSEHRINLLKNFNYETNDISEEDLEKAIKEIHEKHGSSSMPSNDDQKMTKTSSEVTPKSNSNTNTPKEDTNSVDSLDLFEPKPEIKTDINYFLREDILLTAFESHKIIRTYGSDGRDIYYCCYCDEYYNTLKTLERHIDEPTHQKFQTNFSNCSKGLNDKLLMKRFIDPKSEKESYETQALNEIPNVVKHFYFKRGIKYTGADYYCRLCQKSISSFDAIEEHFKSDSHVKIEEKPTNFNDLFLITQPIIGLRYIKEYYNPNSKQLLYECTLCDYSDPFSQMVFHINCFTHQFKALRKIVPNSRVFRYVKENEVSLKSSDLLKKELFRVEQRIGCGFVTKVCEPQELPKTETHSKTSIEEKTKTRTKSTEGKEAKIECQKLSDDQKPDMSATSDPIGSDIPLTEEQYRKSILPSILAIEITTEEEATLLVSIIATLSESFQEYYKRKRMKATETTQMVESRVTQCCDNFEVQKMDES